MMEACGEKERSIAVGTSPACVPAILPDKEQSGHLRRIASDCVFWVGMLLIGIAAIPAGILFGMMNLIVRMVSVLTDRIEND